MRRNWRASILRRREVTIRQVAPAEDRRPLKPPEPIGRLHGTALDRPSIACPKMTQV